LTLFCKLLCKINIIFRVFCNKINTFAAKNLQIIFLSFSLNREIKNVINFKIVFV